MCSDDDDVAFYSCEEEDAAPVRRRTTLPRSSFERALAHSRRRRQLESRGVQLLIQLESLAHSARSKLAEASEAVELHAENVAFAERIIARTVDSTGLRRLALTVDRVGLPLALTEAAYSSELTIETDGHECDSPQQHSATSACSSSSAWSPQVSTPRTPKAAALAASSAAKLAALGDEADATSTSDVSTSFSSRATSRRGSSPLPVCLMTTPLQAETVLCSLTERDGREADADAEEHAAPRQATWYKAEPESNEQTWRSVLSEVSLPPLKLEKRSNGEKRRVHARRPQGFVE